MLFLYPLMLQAYRRVAFQPIAHGSIDGVAPTDADYELETFERLLGERFSIRRREQLPSGARVLYHLHPV